VISHKERPQLPVVTSHRAAVVAEEVVDSAPKPPDQPLLLTPELPHMTLTHSLTKRREVTSQMELNREPGCQRRTEISQRKAATAVVPAREVEEVAVVVRVEPVARTVPLPETKLLLPSSESDD